jgi:CBS domain-containing protein
MELLPKMRSNWKRILLQEISTIVEQIMNRDAKVCQPEDSLNKAAQIMWEHRCGALPVVDKQFRPIGFLTDRDICMGAYTQGKTLSSLRVDTAMAREVFSCKAADDLESAATTMQQKRLRRLPVLDREGKLVGLLLLDDLAHEATRTLRGGENTALRDLVLEILLSINRGRMRLSASSQAPDE